MNFENVWASVKTRTREKKAAVIIFVFVLFLSLNHHLKSLLIGNCDDIKNGVLLFPFSTLFPSVYVSDKT